MNYFDQINAELRVNRGVDSYNRGWYGSASVRSDNGQKIEVDIDNGQCDSMQDLLDKLELRLRQFLDIPKVQKLFVPAIEHKAPERPLSEILNDDIPF